uniref:Replication protein A OB domain-containing protein n=1 Tax=Arundo donax TaxID=35708 RepID=A0A0A9A6L1_ARUDO
MLEFTLYTKISPSKSPQSTFPKYIYKLTTFSEIPSLLGNNKNLVDMLGMIIEVAEPTWVHLSAQPNPTIKRDVILKDTNDLQLKVTLWGRRATQFDIRGVYDPSNPKLVIALFVGGLIRSYQGSRFQMYYYHHAHCP